MDKKLAAAILGISEKDVNDPELIEEQYEEEVFKITSFFLNRAFIPKLAQAKIERLNKLHTAYSSLIGIEIVENQFLESDYGFQNLTTLEALVKDEQSAEMKLKLSLSNAQTANSAAMALSNWSQMVLQYAEKFVELFPKQDSELPKVSFTQIVDYGELLSELKKGMLDGLAIQEYARLSHLI